MAVAKTSAAKKTAPVKTVKPAVKKTETVKKAAKVAVPAKTETKPAAKKETLASSISVPMVDIHGKAAGSAQIASGVLDAKINKQLIALAVRVYLANQREGGAMTKTRGEVEGSTRKIYKQKGTGRARHGAIRAPIFVGGGIVFGPRTHSFSMVIPAEMRKKALSGALTEAYNGKRLVVVSDWTSMKPKTKEAVAMLEAVNHSGRRLLVVSGMSEPVVKSTRNIENVTVVSADLLTTYHVATYQFIVMSKESLEKVAARVAEGNR